MTDAALIGPWIRRFLLEYLVGERNLSINTQRSYRDMLLQLLPFVAAQIRTNLSNGSRSATSPQNGSGYFSASSS